MVQTLSAIHTHREREKSQTAEVLISASPNGFVQLQRRKKQRVRSASVEFCTLKDMQISERAPRSRVAETYSLYFNLSAGFVA